VPRIRLEAPQERPGYAAAGFGCADEQTVHLEGTAAEIPQGPASRRRVLQAVPPYGLREQLQASSNPVLALPESVDTFDLADQICPCFVLAAM